MPEHVFGHGSAQFGASDPRELVSPAGQHPGAQVLQRHRLQTQIDVLSGARLPSIDLALLHRPLGRAGEQAQLAGLGQPVLGLPQPFDEGGFDDVRDHDLVCGENPAQPEGFLAVTGKLSTE